MKQFFLENLATKLMAVFLAIVTWVYLFMQDTGQVDIEVEFTPIVDVASSELASVRYVDSQGNAITPGSLIKARVSGPKADVRSLRPRFYRCSPQITAGSLTDPERKGFNTVTLTLDRQHFDLPEKFSVDPLPSAQIAVHYARYVRRTVRIEVPPGHWEGKPRQGYRVDSIIPFPQSIQARVPADRGDIGSANIQKVPVEDRFKDFTLERWKLEDSAILLVDTFDVEVRIAAEPATRRVTLPLHIVCRPEHLKRIELETKDITVDLKGTRELVNDLADRAGIITAFIIVTDRDMSPAGPHNITLMGCHIQDDRYKDIKVVMMADAEEENRQVKITVK